MDVTKITNQIKELNEQIDSLKKELADIKKDRERDPLTGLMEYQTFFKILEEKTQDFDDNKNLLFMYVDISNFKYFNETSGYEEGNALLKQFGKIINNYDDNVICASRIHSDNFILVSAFDRNIPYEIVVNEYTNKNRKYAKDLQNKYNNYGIFFNSGINIVNGSNKDFVGNAENANYARKLAKNSRSEVVVFKDEMISEQIKNITLISEFESAIVNREFVVYYQPKIDAVSFNIIGGEALVRWIKPDGRIIRPDEFIDLFEKNGYILKLDYYVFDQVFKYIRKRMNEGKNIVPISMNVSRVHMENGNIINHIKYLMNKYRVDSKYIEFELTENIYISEMENTLYFMSEMRKLGIKISMDDFGSGYSSLNVLSNLPIDIVKIDKVFMKNGVLDDNDKIIVECIMSMAKRLKITSVCEGVETNEQSKYLGSIGCEILQGYNFSRPMAEDKFSEYIDKNFSTKGNRVEFDFDGTLSDVSDKYVFETKGNISFEDGIAEDRKVLKLPGSSVGKDIIEMSMIPYLAKDFSLSLWFKDENPNIWTSIFYIEFENVFISLMPNGWNERIVLRLKDKEKIAGYYDITNNIPIETQWVNVVATFNEKRKIMSLYVNGMHSGSIEIEKNPLILKRVILGGDIFQRSFQGFIGEFLVYNKTLNIFEIENIYNHKKHTYGIGMEQKDKDICIHLERIIDEIKENVYENQEYAKILFEGNLIIADNCKDIIKKSEYYLMYIRFKILTNELNDVMDLLKKVEENIITGNIEENFKNSILSDVYNLYGVYYASMKNQIKAIDYYTIAENYAKELDDQGKRAVLLNNMGILYNLIGDKTSAFNKFSEVIEIEEDNNHKYVKGVELINIAEMYLEIENYERAEMYLEKAFRILREKQNYDDIGTCYSVAALLYEKTGRDSLAYESYEKAYQMDAKYVNGMDFEITRNNMIRFFIKNRNYKKAENLIKEIDENKKKYVSYKNLLDLYDMAIDYSQKIEDENGEVYYLGKYHDVMETYWKEVNSENSQCIENILSAEMLKKNNEELKYSSQKDDLTGLGNRYRLEDKGERIVRNASDFKERIGILIIDIDRFKDINDTFGHLYGDKCIVETGRIIKNSIGDNYIYRFGGDEFVVIIENANRENVEAIIKKIRKEIKNLNKVTISIGAIEFIPEENKGIYDYIRIADVELYKAKEKRNNYFIKTLDVEY